MPKITITPAFSPDLLCEFEIPRKNARPIEFSVVRVEYSKDFEERWLAWLTKRMEPQPVLDDSGKPVVDQTTGEPETKPAEPLSDEESIVEQLRIAGVPEAKCKQLAALTRGELQQIFKAWVGASKVTVGESEASDA